jgi:exopolysaccharide production protein ExoY
VTVHFVTRLLLPLANDWMPLRETPVANQVTSISRPLADPSARINGLHSRRVGERIRTVVVVGAPEDVPRALQHPAVAAGQFQIAGLLAVDVEADDAAQNLSALGELLARHDADTILVAGLVGAAVMRHVADLAILYHCDLLAVMPSEVIAGHAPVIVWSGDSPLVQIARLPRYSWEVSAKRAIDIVGASLGLLVTAPLLALFAAVIKLQSPGPVLFRHDRVGRFGKRFSCLKLRTMRADAEDYLRARPAMYEEYRRNHFKLSDGNDPRVTSLGKLLRRTSIDELPQLWNVLKGDMSLVGPRPVVDEELDLYGDRRALLLSVQPGLTGYWAVRGRHSVGYPERCELELAYIREWRLSTDLATMFSTVRAVIQPGGED